MKKEILEINVLQHVPISSRKLEEIQKETELQLKSLKEIIMKGWPGDRESLPESVKPYYSVKGELTVYDGIILKGDKVVQPALRAEILKQLHSTHIGIESCIKSRECVFLPGITSDIKDYFSHCDVCTTYANKNQKEPLQPHELTNRPWEKVGADLCKIVNNDFLICVNYFSNFAEIEYLSNKTAETVIN